ncbi:phage holin family protein [Nocardioides agariphilus]|uniref:Phage holin family protein n=1 Tax=Nocardioides agariphilus TaxID=433664 RepID=A0A930YI86_9ACTN|nr:phage holin family protein [Nocardioides agariphilus]MBF4767833.1 phage holin family protein [Nocardioides agariphilus]
MAIEPLKDEPTIGRLVSDASRDISSLLQKEIQLAKSEIKVSVRNGGLGAGLFAGAAFFAVMALIMFSVGLAYLIHWNGSGLDLHWAFLSVFVFYLLIAALLAYVGYRKVRKVRPPDKAIAEAQNIKQALTKRGGEPIDG